MQVFKQFSCKTFMENDVIRWRVQRTHRMETYLVYKCSLSQQNVCYSRLKCCTGQCAGNTGSVRHKRPIDIHTYADDGDVYSTGYTTWYITCCAALYNIGYTIGYTTGYINAVYNIGHTCIHYWPNLTVHKTINWSLLCKFSSCSIICTKDIWDHFKTHKTTGKTV